MITQQKGQSISYLIDADKFILSDPIDQSKKMSFDVSQVPPNSTLNLQLPDSSGSFLVLGSNIVGYITALINSELTILDSKVKSSSLITATYRSYDPVTQGTLSVASVNPFSSFTIRSSKSDDNNTIYVIVIY